MFVVFKDSLAIACFTNQDTATEYWRVNGGTIVFYPDLGPGDVFIH